MSDVTWGFPDGRKVVFHDDGSVSVTTTNGYTTKWDKDGKKTKFKPDGTKIDDWSPQSTESPAAGGKTYKYSNGDKIEFPPKKGDPIIYTPPSGDWKRIIYDPKTGTITYEPSASSGKTSSDVDKPTTKDGKAYDSSDSGSKSGGGKSGR